MMANIYLPIYLPSSISIFLASRCNVDIMVIADPTVGLSPAGRCYEWQEGGVIPTPCHTPHGAPEMWNRSCVSWSCAYHTQPSCPNACPRACSDHSTVPWRFCTQGPMISTSSRTTSRRSAVCKHTLSGTSFQMYFLYSEELQYFLIANESTHLSLNRKFESLHMIFQGLAKSSGLAAKKKPFTFVQ